MDISVVVPTLKPRDEIEVTECLERGEFEDYELLVQDEYPVTRARNEGIRAASAEKIVFLDDDSCPRGDYLRRMSSVLDTEKAVAGRTVHPNDDVFAGQLTSHYDFGDEPRYVDRFWGCNMAARKEVFDTVGGWDEGMGWGHEEKELADRVIQQHRIYYHPELVVYHPYADSVRDYWRKQYELETQTPYYWDKKGVSRTWQLLRTAELIVNPRYYLAWPPRLTLVKLGGAIAKCVGRLVGITQRLDDERTVTREQKPVSPP
jgi:glycosyltransferase involved in cell wall biosynthesis